MKYKYTLCNSVAFLETKSRMEQGLDTKGNVTPLLFCWPWTIEQSIMTGHIVVMVENLRYCWAKCHFQHQHSTTDLRLQEVKKKKKSYLHNLNPVTIYALLQIANPIAKYVLLLYLKPRWHKFYINDTCFMSWSLCNRQVDCIKFVKTALFNIWLICRIGSMMMSYPSKTLEDFSLLCDKIR